MGCQRHRQKLNLQQHGASSYSVNFAYTSGTQYEENTIRIEVNNT